MSGINVLLETLRENHPNMCGAVLHIPLLGPLVATARAATDDIPALPIRDDHVDRYCIADAGHEGDHVVWVPNGAWISAYEHLPAGWSVSPELARQLAIWVEAGRPYPRLGSGSWV